MDIKPDGIKEINSGAELVEYSMNQIKFTMNNEFVKKLRRLYTIEQYHIKRMADEATFHQYTKLMEIFTGIFTKMMENGIIKKCDPVVLALEYLAPVSLLIQITDRDPDKKDEVKEMIKRFLTHFVDTYFLK
ncbi:MAG: hypothetical protein J6X85_03950 [Ruminococcus sp.]|nr:hypothetical protein [Ruminococcus sp.]